MATQAKTRNAGPANRALRIVAKRDGFRRAGHVFGSAAVTLPLNVLSDDQYEQLKSEPMLVVSEVDIEAPKE